MLATVFALPLLFLSSASLAAGKTHGGHHVSRRHPSGPAAAAAPLLSAANATAVGSDADLEDVDPSSLPLQERGAVVRVGSMPSGFHGRQSGIGSWYQADSGRDSTDGTSWCGIHYHDNSPLFAPKFSTMSPSQATWGTNPAAWKRDASKYCGLQAEVTYRGRKQLLYIGDAFDDRWVRTPGSIDILKGPWTKLFGRGTNSKDVVMKDLHWKLTGKRSKTYSFKG